ncbi:AAA family ATPase [Enterobacter asburiae]|uniref:AAA family ATPase n=1 Tax=Enterobacter asburiae TaxID=61645 RepID=UPI001EF7DC4E|nr:ABC transporter ATP-binding protein [Enterobacter asburiae]MCG7801272.1 AAA family ATPase [Enterobacter asburiae]
MVNFPILKRLEINEYQLYPGKNKDKNLTVDFEAQGLTVILGANGLGKSTLINLLLRMLTGPSDIARIDSIDELGNLNTAAVDRKDLKNFFAERVSDKAEKASAKLEVKFGDIQVSIERSLSDLTLTDLRIGATLYPLPDNRRQKEDIYKEKISELVGVSSFGDWLLLLHYIVFYQENRRALVWDTSAQREILRILLLSKEQSQTWRELSREVLTLDSDYRNYRSSVSKEIKKFERTLGAITDKKGSSAQATAEKTIRNSKLKELDKINNIIDNLNLERSKLRLELLTVTNSIDEKEKALQYSKIKLLKKILPNSNDTARYISSVLFSEITKNDTLDTKNLVNAITALLDREYLNGQNEIALENFNSGDNDPSDLYELKKIKTLLVKNIETISNKHDAHTKKANALIDEINDINIRLLPLETELAKDEKPISKLQLQLDALESLKKDKEESLTKAHIKFTEFLNGIENLFFKKADEIQNKFNEIVQGFLIEDFEVTWSETDWKLGQEERPIKFPAFIFKMSSNGNKAITVRTKPAQVSESQREFIDLAFRIALIQVVASNNSGSIIMDAPESSLDAVFVDRAAHIFNMFSNQANNKLVLASNLIDGLLLPLLLSHLIKNNNLETGLVNLFEVGVPSRAVEKYRESYNNHFQLVLDKAYEVANSD